MQRAGNTLRIVLRLRGMTQFWNPPNGFDHVAVTAFLQLPERAGGSTLMPQQNGSLPEGMRWHYRMRTHGWSNAWFSAEGADAASEGRVSSPGAQVVADAGARTPTITIPAKALDNPASLSGIKLYLNTWDYDGGYRGLSPEGGGMLFGGEDGGGIAAHRIAQFDARNLVGNAICQVRRLDPVRAAPLFGAGPFGKARGIGEIVFAALNRGQHLRQQFGVVLVVSIHNRDNRRGGGAHALNRGRSQTPAANALDAAHARIRQRDAPRLVRRAIGAVVIDDDDFPGKIGRAHV